MAFRAFLTAAALLLTAPAFASAEQVLRVPLFAEPVALDPHLIDGLVDFRICNDLFEPLTTLDAEGGLIPGAAESWSESADHLSWTFTLRADERWSDGSAVTSVDFLYSLRRIVDPKTAASYAAPEEPPAADQPERVAEAKRLFAAAWTSAGKLKLRLLAGRTQTVHRDVTALKDQAVIPWAHETTQYLLNPRLRGWGRSPLAIFPSRFISIAP
ncbi:hypothetical protein GCM10011611_42510 [Aliidongia dinghuensis]|uniref:Solute-binding protein family 5 domain-containing protein n=1 Tax=Aliidongia dinghuensis TaxID=1867774 RepID=A0A8J2YY53_9PROT|nr:ABC transporter substrate-binding protein [Aliidongia dinghuensis]GGF31901.1 hypothetical protein GCM10011611_42510 [Aliidongia dinghuensis]